MFVRRAALLVALVIATLVTVVGQRAAATPADFSSQLLRSIPRDDRAVALLSTALGDRVSSIVHAFAVDWDHDGDVDVVAGTRDAALVLWINDGHGHLQPHRIGLEGRLTSSPAVLGGGPSDGDPAMPSGHLHDAAPAVLCRWVPLIESTTMALESSASIVTVALVGPATRAPPSSLS
jgi:hypothetical protein